MTGDKQIAYTVGEMKRLIRTYASDTDRYGFKNLFDVFEFVRRIPYVRDIDAGYDELLKRPSAGARSGDCDDKTIFAAAALSGLNVPWRIVAVSYKPDRELGHVYLEVFNEGEWKPFDATYPENEIFSERPYTRKVYGDDLVRHYTMHGVTTLEGFGQTPSNKIDFNTWGTYASNALQIATGDKSANISKISVGAAIATATAAAQAAIPIPGIGAAVGAVIGAIGGIIGIRGPTAHMSYDEANAYANRIAKMVADIFNRLPQDGKDYMAAQVKMFLDKMVADFGKWWGGMDLGAGDDPAEGFLNRILRQGMAKGWFNTQGGAVYYAIFFPVYAVMRAADAETVKDNFQNWVWDTRFKPIVLDPVQKFVQTRFQQTVEWSQTGTVTTSIPEVTNALQLSNVFSGSGGMIFLLLGLGIVFSTMGKKHQARRRRR